MQNISLGPQIYNATNKTDNMTVSISDRYSFFTFFLNFAPAYIALDRYLSLVWFVFGFGGNLLSFIVWITPRIYRDNSSAIYLAALSLTDFFLLLLMVIQDLMHAWNIHPLKSYGMCEVFYIFLYTLQYVSPILVLGFTVERWIAICYPFKREQLCTTKRATTVVICLFVFVLLLSSPQGYFWMFDTTSQTCNSRQSANSSPVWTYYTWIMEALMSAVLPCLILVFNILVLREFHKITSRSSNHCRDPVASQGDKSAHSLRGGTGNSAIKSTTAMLLTVSFFLICCTLPAGLMYALQSVTPEGAYNLTDEQVMNDPTWRKYLRMMVVKKAVDELSLSHFAINFIIYFCTGRIYRRKAIELLSCNRISHQEEHGDYSYVSARRSESRFYSGGVNNHHSHSLITDKSPDHEPRQTDNKSWLFCCVKRSSKNIAFIPAPRVGHRNGLGLEKTNQSNSFNESTEYCHLANNTSAI